jgi:hypothetical protein
MPGLRRWFDPGWWAYLRNSYPNRLVAAGGLIAGALAVAGYLSVSTLGNSSKSGGDYGLLTTTVKGNVRVVRVVRTVAGRETLRGATQVTLYRRRVVNGKPVTVKQVVAGKSVTVSRVITDPRSSTIVRSQTQTIGQTQTVTRTEPGPSRTVTVPGDGVTDTVVVTTTVMAPITITVPVTVTVPTLTLP